MLQQRFMTTPFLNPAKLKEQAKVISIVKAQPMLTIFTTMNAPRAWFSYFVSVFLAHDQLLPYLFSPNEVVADLLKYLL